MGVAPVARQQGEQEGAQHVAFGWGVAAGVLQWAVINPAREYAGGGQKFGKEDQLAVWRGCCRFIPAYVHAPAQCVNDLRL